MLETGERIPQRPHTLYFFWGGDENDAQLHTTTFIYSYLLKYLRLATHNQTYNYKTKTIFVAYVVTKKKKKQLLGQDLT